jgi:hypothetical protein
MPFYTKTGAAWENKIECTRGRPRGILNNEASTALRWWYPSFLRRNPPKHPPSLCELRGIQLSHSSTA